MTSLIQPDPSSFFYDLAAEHARVSYADVVIGERRLNRGTAEVQITGPVETEATAATRSRWNERLFPTTLDEMAPVLHLGWPTHGPFVSSPQGVYMDTYLGVAQKVLDENHPNFRKMLRDLDAAGATLRREIVTDDFLTPDDSGLVKTPPQLSALWCDAVNQRFPVDGGYKAFFSSSGAEAVEAGLKLAYVSAYKRFVAKHGMDVLRQVMAELDIGERTWFERDPSLADHPVFETYPFCIVACEGAFHGRTHGALSLTHSKRAHRLGYPMPFNVFHVPYNSDEDVVRELIDTRDIQTILETPGELKRVLFQEHRIPKDLFSGFIAEPFQGEGGYVPGNPRYWQRIEAVCREHEALLIADEVQSVARTGTLLMTEHLGVTPDVVCTAKSMVIGVTIARADLGQYTHGGWHSNTWGAGRVLDTNFAFQTLDTLLNFRDPVFDGRSYFENVQIKGDYLRLGLAQLANKHPDTLTGFHGMGLMNAIMVRDRDTVIEAGWKHGLKLLGCGFGGEVAPIRVLMLADTLTREVDEFLRALGKVLAAVEGAA